MAEATPQTVFDTGQQYLGSVYAKALIGAGETAGNTESVLGELDSVVEVLAQLPALQQTLESPRVPLEVKQRLLDSSFGGKVSAQSLRFLKVAARRGRLDCLPAIARAARQQFNQMRGRVEVHVQSADELDEQAIETVKSMLQERLGREVELQLSVDSELIAGLVVRVGDTVYDGSLANRLLKLRGEMVGRAGRRIGSELDRFALKD